MSAAAAILEAPTSINVTKVRKAARTRGHVRGRVLSEKNIDSPDHKCEPAPSSVEVWAFDASEMERFQPRPHKFLGPRGGYAVAGGPRGHAPPPTKRTIKCGAAGNQLVDTKVKSQYPAQGDAQFT